LFRKYNYPDKALVEAFKDEELKKHLNLISQVAVEIKQDGSIQEYGRSAQPEHITRRVGDSHDSSGGSIRGGSDPRAEQEGKDAGACVETSSGGGGRVAGSEGNQENLVVYPGQEHRKDGASPGAVQTSTE
jgi:hypothetical protein